MGNTILLADKSITIQKIVELTFAEDQFEIKCVNDGQAALDLIPQMNPDIILADISLPVKSGYDVCRALRTDPAFSSFSEIPVILLAGIYETMDEERSKQVEEKVKEVGANDLLSKPFDPQLLTTKVKDLMIQKSIGTFQSPTGTMDTFSFDSPTADSSAFTDSFYNPEPSVDDTGTFDAPPEPPDDTEKTMILSVPPSFARDMFAQSPPFEKEPENGQPVNELDLDSVKPVNEQLFDASDLEAESSQGFFDSPSISDDSPDSLFQSNPEISSGDMQWTDSAYDMISPEVSSENEQPVHYADFPEPTSTSYPEPSSIPVVDEPFGDVLQEEPTVQATWDSSAASDEEVSPFGFPEPEAPKKVEDYGEQTVAYNPHEEISSLSHDAADAFMMNEPALDIQEPLAERVLEDTDPNKIWTEPQDEKIWTEPQDVSDIREPEVNEPSEQSRVATVTEPEEAVELQPDLTDVSVNPEPEPPPPVEEPTAEVATAAPAQANQKIEVTEELIDKIVERVIAKMSLPILSDIVWQVVPDLAEKMIKRELEKLHSDDE
jgi:CheY-like chemotaxis protein